MELKRCCGMNLHFATRACLIYVMVTSLIAGTLALLDLIDMKDPNWEIGGSFSTEWRIHINPVMMVLDVLMMISHWFVFAVSIVTFHVTRSEDAKLNICMLLFFAIIMSLYILVEFAVNMYFFTWMNHNIWILPYLAVLWVFWVVRLILNILVVIVAHSRMGDLRFQKKYDLLNMPGVNHSQSMASHLSGSMRSVHSQHMRASSQRLNASRLSLQKSQQSLNRSQVSLNKGAANI